MIFKERKKTEKPTTPVEPAAPISPIDRPMEKAAPAEVKPKKKKTGLIAGIIAVVAVLFIGSVLWSEVAYHQKQKRGMKK